MCIMSCGKKKFRSTPLMNNPFVGKKENDFQGVISTLRYASYNQPQIFLQGLIGVLIMV
jgi:hypothetical protein